ncbi:hypothetical protein KGP36_06480 [Patescibacteria group bacterium]|nr:hypothetical protein [Patescibacteria group bacterium]
MYLSDLMDPDRLDELVADGYISARAHPFWPLKILNYTAKTQYENLWTPETENCRGLVIAGSGLIVGLPFKKFYNLDRDNPYPPFSEWFNAYDKADGSLGIIFEFVGLWDISTRGSFESEQAQWARKKLHYYLDALEDSNLTYLVEIVYPANRIVVNYEQDEKLILLGARDRRTGEFIPPESIAWPDDKAELLHSGPLSDILEMPPRKNAEGLVLYSQTGDMWKLKQEDYVELHKLLFGLTSRKVWEYLAVCDLADISDVTDVVTLARFLRMDPLDVQAILDRVGDTYLGRGAAIDHLAGELPDEFHPWLTEQVRYFTSEFDRIWDAALNQFSWWQNLERKVFAAKAKETQWPSLLFAMLDGQITAHIIWNMLYPEHSKAMIRNPEDSE